MNIILKKERKKERKKEEERKKICKFENNEKNWISEKHV